jgi:VCBS repeat-containing protein
MRQGNGSELLGTNDPRSSGIGIIHVSPSDDRKSVLAAILTQEKLGRKQVVVVLPAVNKAFQRSQDFEDLKNIRRRLQTQIVLIAPAGPGPAEFARQRRFPVYSSLESYANALNDGEQLPVEQKKGRIFGAGKSQDENLAVSGGTATAAGVVPSGDVSALPTQPVANTQDDLRESALSGRSQSRRAQANDDQHASSVAPIVAAGVAGGAAGIAADRALHAHEGSSTNTGSIASAPSTSSVADYDDEGDMLSPAPAASGSVAPRKYPTGPMQPHGDDAGSPPIIELRGKGKGTGNLSPSARNSGSLAGRPVRKSTTGKMVAGAAGAGALAAGAAAATTASSAAPTRTGGGGVPPGGGRSGGGGGGPQGSNRRPWLIGVALLLIVTLLICAGISYAQPGVLGPLQHAIPGAQSPATITLTPDNQVITGSYVVTGVNSAPDATKLQVSSHQVTGNAQTSAKTVTATGHNQTAGTRATGFLTFTNGSGSAMTVGSGTTIQNSDGVAVVTNAPAVVPASDPANGTFGTTSVSAHAADVGAGGNINSLTISKYCCVAGSVIFVKNNSAFGGGRDPKNYMFVQQSDIDGVVNNVRQQLLQQSLAALQGQMSKDEQLVSSPQCNLKVTADQPIGDKGANVPSVSVGVSQTCTAPVYNQTQMLSLVTKQLQTKADTSLGAGYAPVGKVQLDIKKQNAIQGVQTFLVNAKGNWAYQISKTKEQELARLIAGKTVDSARVTLEAQKGIGKVNIQVNGPTLPSDPGQIAFVLQPVTGFPDNGPTISLTPTVTGAGGVNGSQQPAQPGQTGKG